MVAPIAGLFLGLGLMGARSLVQSRQASVRQEGLQGALSALFGVGGPMTPEQAQSRQPGFVGPPTPLAQGSVLTDSQTAALQALSASDPALALQMGLDMQQRNLTLQQQERQWEMQNARLELSQDTFELQERAHDFNVTKWIAQNNADLQDTADAARIFADPGYSLQTALGNGQDTYVIGNTPDGVPKVAPVPGSADFVAAEESVRENARVQSNLSDLRELSRQWMSAGADPASPMVRDMQALVNDIQLTIKDSEFGLGALAGPDADFLAAIVADPTALAEQLTSNPGALDQGYARLADRLNNRQGAQLSRMQGWLGLNENIMVGAVQQAQRANNLNVESARIQAVAAEETAASMAARRAAVEGLGRTGIDDVFMALLGDEQASQRIRAVRAAGMQQVPLITTEQDLEALERQAIRGAVDAAGPAGIGGILGFLSRGFIR